MLELALCYGRRARAANGKQLLPSAVCIIISQWLFIIWRLRQEKLTARPLLLFLLSNGCSIAGLIIRMEVLRGKGGFFKLRVFLLRTLGDVWTRRVAVVDKEED